MKEIIGADYDGSTENHWNCKTMGKKRPYCQKTKLPFC